MTRRPSAQFAAQACSPRRYRRAVRFPEASGSVCAPKPVPARKNSRSGRPFLDIDDPDVRFSGYFWGVRRLRGGWTGPRAPPKRAASFAWLLSTSVGTCCAVARGLSQPLRAITRARPEKLTARTPVFGLFWGGVSIPGQMDGSWHAVQTRSLLRTAAQHVVTNAL